MSDLPPRSRRVIGLALLGSAAFLVTMALVIYTGVIVVGAEMKDVMASVLGGVAAVDLLLGLWFWRSSLSS